MNWIKKLHQKKLLSEKRLLEIYPPFLMMGVKVKEISADYRRLHVYLPLRWYGKNLYGTMFGGFMLSVSDPLALLLLEQHIPGTQGWTKHHSVDFLRPATSGLDCIIELTDEDIDSVKKSLEETGQATHSFRFTFTDERGRGVAKITNVVFVRKLPERFLKKKS